MGLLDDRPAEESARKADRAFGAGASGRSGLPAPMMGSRQRGHAPAPTRSAPAAAPSSAGWPGTVTLERVAQSIANDIPTFITGTKAIRQNLVDWEGPSNEIVWPRTGTVYFYILGAWVDDPGAFTALVWIDGVAVWEARLLPVSMDGVFRFGPITSDGVPIYAGETVQFLVHQDSGATKTIDFAHLGIAQLEVGPASPLVLDMIALSHADDGSGTNAKIMVQQGRELVNLAPNNLNLPSGTCWFPDGSRVVLTDNNSTEARWYYVWNVASGDHETDWEIPPDAWGAEACAVFPDGSKLVLGIATDFDGYLHVVDTSTRLLESGWPELSSQVYAVAVSPDGAYIAVMTSSQGLQVIDVATKTIDTAWDAVAGGGFPNGAAFNLAGTKLAVANEEGLTVLDVATKTIETGWGGPTQASAVGWSPDGARLAVGTAFGDDEYYVIDVATKTAETGWPSIEGNAQGVAWRDDGVLLGLAFTRTGDNGFTVIDVASKTRLADSAHAYPILDNHGRKLAFPNDPGNVLSS